MDILLNNKLDVTAAAIRADVSKKAEGGKSDLPFYGGYSLPSCNNMLNPSTPGVASFWVCNSNFTSCCCCLWTVPDGVTKAQFQVWGGGGNTSSCDGGSCCAFGSPAFNGEYSYALMTVTPGQTFTLCAGGGIHSSQNACYNYCDCNGCTSYVCSEDGVYLRSCGGITSFCNSMESAGRENFRGQAQHSGASGAANGMFHQTNNDQCSGMMIGCPAYLYEGESLGALCIAPTNNNNVMLASSKIPRLSWGIRACGQSALCYMCAWTYLVHEFHEMCRVGTGWTGYTSSGCCFPGNCGIRRPGLAGAPALHPCYSSGPNWGQCGNAGAIKVTYL